MAIYQSNLVRKLMRHRGLEAGKDYDVAGRIMLPAGTVLTTADDLLFIPVGENQVIQKVSLMVIGNPAALASSIGYFQITKGGVPVVVTRQGPQGAPATQFTSPASSPAAYRAATAMPQGYTEVIVTPPVKLAGPVNIGLRITTGATIVADTEIFLGAYFKGETATTGQWGILDRNNAYLLK